MKETKTISEGLGKYAIGAKLRRLRLRKSMGLLELSKHEQRQQRLGRAISRPLDGARPRRLSVIEDGAAAALA